MTPPTIVNHEKDNDVIMADAESEITNIIMMEVADEFPMVS